MIVLDLIEITNRDGSKVPMEVVFTFNIEITPDTYIIYRDIKKNDYYLGKYRFGSNILDTDLTEEEYKLCKKIYEKVVEKNA